MKFRIPAPTTYYKSITQTTSLSCVWCVLRKGGKLLDWMWGSGETSQKVGNDKGDPDCIPRNETRPK